MQEAGGRRQDAGARRQEQSRSDQIRYRAGRRQQATGSGSKSKIYSTISRTQPKRRLSILSVKYVAMFIHKYMSKKRRNKINFN